jgi:hypothetical protein
VPDRRKGGCVPSFEMIYEEDEDVLEVTFEVFDEHFARTVSLNDNIVLYTDTSLSVAWGLTFYSYAQLLQVNETILEGLRSLPESDARRLLAVLRRRPATHFLQVTDPADLRACICAPGLQDLLGS